LQPQHPCRPRPHIAATRINEGGHGDTVGRRPVTCGPAWPAAQQLGRASCKTGPSAYEAEEPVRPHPCVTPIAQRHGPGRAYRHIRIRWQGAGYPAVPSADCSGADPFVTVSEFLPPGTVQRKRNQKIS
jgi:hypothetical protein